MFRSSASSRLLRQGTRTIRSSYRTAAPSSKRFITTEPPHKSSRSWKNSATRWAIAIGGVYWYNTTPLFSEQPQYTVQGHEAPLPTLESLSRSSRFSLPSSEDLPVLPVQPSDLSPPSIDPKSPLPQSLDTPSQSPEDLEAEAASQGAFNEETGEINWDCPCLGGMAHGPCGPEFREAFSCFVFSKEEPKGMDCVDKFKGMQTCFREHPEEYGDQLEEDEEEVEQELAARKAEGAGGDSVNAAAAEGVVAVAKEGIAGGDAAKVLDADASEKKNVSPKRSIYDDESDAKATSKSGNSKVSSGVAGDLEAELLPLATHNATDAKPASQK